MKIVFLTHYFPPEVNAPAVRTFEHCRAWVRAGDEVHVVTGIPSHPRGRPFPGYQRAWYQKELIDGIQVHRVWTWLAPNAGVFNRSLNFGSFLPAALWRTVRLGECDVLVATSPQFFCAVAGWLAAKLTGVPWVFELRDLWPDSIAAVGAVRADRLLRWIEKIELKMYRDASMVACLTTSFMENLRARGIDSGKLCFLPNGVDVGYWDQARTAGVRESLGFSPEDVVVSYIGTIGMAHGLGTVIECARKLEAPDSRVRFLIVGDGSDFEKVKDRSRAEGLHNLALTGLVDHERARDLLAASDIALVVLRDTPLFRSVLPSKMFEAMGARRPIVLAVQGEARTVLEEAGAGIAVAPEDAEELARAIRRIAGDPELRSRMGNAGRRFVEERFNRARWADRYLELLRRVGAQGIRAQTRVQDSPQG